MLKRVLPALVCLFAFAACGEEDGVASKASARAAYLGLDNAIEKALNLGFKGFNEASSATIPPQTTDGDVMGTMNVTGKADQGASANKGMRLDVELIGYQDILAIVDVDDADIDFAVVYDTDPAALPYLEAKFSNYPNGTFTGSFTGTVNMSGDLKGIVTLNLSFSGQTEEDPVDPTKVVRVDGTTTVTGTATSSYGTFDISLTI
jgi:hypothetical protein